MFMKHSIYGGLCIWETFMKYMKKLFIFILHEAALFFTPDVTYFNIHKRLSGITGEEFAPISLPKCIFISRRGDGMQYCLFTCLSTKAVALILYEQNSLFWVLCMCVFLAGNAAE